MKINNILVTGSGGDIGQSIGKILKMEYGKLVKIIGCDIIKNHAGMFIFDEFKLISKANSENYLDDLKNLCENYEIDLIIPTSEAELEFFLKNKISFIEQIPLIIPNFKAIEIGNNKLLTQKFLKENNLPFAWTIRTNEGSPKELPCIVKHISGKGSKDVKIITESNYNENKYNDKNYIYQEFISSEKKEYTCGLFRSNNNLIHTIIFNRKLTGGYTSFGEVIENNNIEEILKNIAIDLDLRGSINIQLRLKNDGTPVVFEINPRFSSTVLFRYMLGFKDLIWSIENFLENDIDSNYKKSEIVGSKIYKGWQEYYCDSTGNCNILNNKNFTVDEL